MYIKPETSLKKREELMDSFYRSELKKQIPTLINKWRQITGICIKELKIKKMKTKWGTGNPKYQRVWLNLELAKKPLHCIEYVLVHEMTHFIKKDHTGEFKLLLKSFMPQWNQYKEELNRGTLGHSKWNIRINTCFSHGVFSDAVYPKIPENFVSSPPKTTF